jgi:hypothetical protein
MSRDVINVVGVVGGRVRALVGKTGVAIRGALGRRDGRAILVGTTVVYFLLYEWGLGHLGGGRGDIDILVVANPLARAVEQTAPFQFEAVALLSLGPVEYLFSPLSALLGLVLAVLVAVNLAVSWVVWRGPTACRVSPGVGALAGIPALLSGAACCGPTILLVLGLQASVGLIALFQWLVPIAFLMLIGTLLLVGRHVDPDGSQPV